MRQGPFHGPFCLLALQGQPRLSYHCGLFPPAADRLMKKLWFFLLLGLSPLCFSNGVQVGQPLPALAIDQRGELLLKDEEYSFSPWRLPEKMDKVHVLQYMAGRMSARSQSKPFTDRLQTALPLDSYHVTTIINLDDALWGTSGFVIGEVKDSKKKYPLSTIVLDETGTGLETWQLRPKGAAILVLDELGTLLYMKEGGMSDSEIESTLELMRQHIADSNS
jgi:YtfJ family uncharacterized protein